MTLRNTPPLAHLLGYGVVGLLVILFVLYVLFQARFLLVGPVVTLTNEPASVQHERQITLSGVAENITKISINGRSIATDGRGFFSSPIILENGYTIVSIAAEDRYGRETIITRPYVYVPQTFVPVN